MFKNTLQFFGKVSMDTPVAQANEFTQFNQYAIGSKHKDESRFDHHAKLHSLQGLSLARNLPDVTGFLWEPIPDEAKVTPNNTSDSILGLLDQLAAANGVTPASSSSSSSSSAASPGSSTHVSKHNITKKKLGHMGYLLDKGFNTTLSKEEKTYREMMFFPRGWSGLPHVPVDLIGPGGHNALVQERESATVVALLTVAQHYVEKTTEPAEAVAQGISEFHEGSHARLEAMLGTPPRFEGGNGVDPTTSRSGQPGCHKQLKLLGHRNPTRSRCARTTATAGTAANLTLTTTHRG